MPSIIKKFPNCTLKIQCSLYPSSDSAKELELCLDVIKELNLSKNVELDTKFYERDQMLNNLADADLALLAYSNSDEGGSAAAADCLACGLPLIVSSADIFQDIHDYCYTVDGDHSSWSDAILHLFESPDEYLKLSKNSHKYSTLHNWNIVSQGLLKSIIIN